MLKPGYHDRMCGSRLFFLSFSQSYSTSFTLSFPPPRRPGFTINILERTYDPRHSSTTRRIGQLAIYPSKIMILSLQAIVLRDPKEIREHIKSLYIEQPPPQLQVINDILDGKDPEQPKIWCIDAEFSWFGHLVNELAVVDCQLNKIASNTLVKHSERVRAQRKPYHWSVKG
ncbi:hypothetical protein MMC14_006864 [Varicellaria rhodocarpa]|nr:hypothetical protein [Varicellaria rhodocarpa]